jgi:hypothetical protein
LAAAKFKTQGIDVAGVVTFGQPPVGGRKFKQQFEKSMSKSSVLRFVNHTDVVANIVSPIAFLTLEHVGNLRYFDTAGRLHDGKPTVLQLHRDAACAPSLEAGAELLAHGVHRYVHLLFQKSPSVLMTLHMEPFEDHLNHVSRPMGQVWPDSGFAVFPPRFWTKIPPTYHLKWRYKHGKKVVSAISLQDHGHSLQIG